VNILKVLYGEKNVLFNEMMMSVLYLTNMLNCILIKLTHWNGQTCWSTWKHYPDSEPSSLCFCSLMMSG